MKNFNGLTILIMSVLFLIGCGNDKSEKNVELSKEAPSKTINNSTVPKSFYIKGVEDLTFSTGTEEYKVCLESQAGYENTLMFLYNKDKRQIEYDRKKEVETKQAGKAFENTWSIVRSVALVNQCPSGAAARCEVSNINSWYYTKSPIVLEHFKKNCALLSANIWTENP